MNSNQDNGHVRARKTMEKMKNPKMETAMDEFRKIDVHIPSGYRLPFIKSLERFNKNEAPFSEIKRRSKFNQPESLYNMINGEVQEKFHAVYYHLQNAIYLQKLVNEYTNRVIDTAKELGIDWPVTVGLTLRKLHFEYEAFILQCRACLDHFVVSLSYYFGFYTIKIDKLKKKLEELSPKDAKALTILNLMNKRREFYDIIKSKTKSRPSNLSDRDRIAHYGRVLMRPLNIMINPTSGTKILQLARHEKEEETFEETLALPSLVEFMKSLMRDLFSFIIEIYDVIFMD